MYPILLRVTVYHNLNIVSNFIILDMKVKELHIECE